MGLIADEVDRSEEKPRKRHGHPRRVRPSWGERDRYVVSELAVYDYRDRHPERVAPGSRRSNYDLDRQALELRKLWIKRGRYFGRTRSGDKIVVCRPPRNGHAGRKNIYILVRPGREKSGIIGVLTEKQARELARQSRRSRHR